ncbi:unnamed protein product [Phyllotreta striolata]|uniref:Acyl-coenzyme A thioesterase 13 n=1 Tax=Phyllotreta striolata TaxID=444603 RepID=A0A9N9TGN8_PHYSR|nr:unnamed protein product [Phyllotreta striolata]
MAKLAIDAKQFKNLLETTKRFNKCLKAINLVELGKGRCTATLKVKEEHTNSMGTMQAGFAASLVDTISSHALFTHEKGNHPSVSVNINVSYLKGIKEGEEILIEADTLKVGKTMAFLQVLIKNKINGNLLVKGEHTMFLLQK